MGLRGFRRDGLGLRGLWGLGGIKGLGLRGLWG